MVRLGELQAASVHMSSKRMFEDADLVVVVDVLGDVRCLAVCMMCMYLTNESFVIEFLHVYMLCTHTRLVLPKVPHNMYLPLDL